MPTHLKTRCDPSGRIVGMASSPDPQDLSGDRQPQLRPPDTLLALARLMARAAAQEHDLQSRTIGAGRDGASPSPLAILAVFGPVGLMLTLLTSWT